MATLSGADANLNPVDQKKILAAKDAYAKAQAEGNDAAMKQANADAEAVRIANGYYGGASGNNFTTVGASSSDSKPLATHPTGYTNIVDRTDVSSLNANDRARLSLSDQQAIAKLKTAYANATDQATKDYINSIADTIRSKEHYSLGRTGSDFSALAYGQGGRSAEEMGQWVSDYRKAYTNYGSEKYYGPHVGWTNGYSVSMNTRSIANMIRQQMDANEKAMNDSNRETLHAQNIELAKLLNRSDKDPVGNRNLLTYYNPELGRWETSSGDLGYGYDLSYTQPNIRNDVKNFYGYTDEEMEAWANDTSRYYNFVDTDIAQRNAVDESSGYTGRYAQFVNGPYALTGGTGGRMNGGLEMYEDVYGDGFYDEEFFGMTPKYDENGNIIKQAPRLKNNNNMTEYQAQFAPVAASGVLSGQGAATPLITDADPYNSAGQTAYYNNYGRYSALGVPSASSGASGSSGSTYENYLNQMYDAALQAQMASLESSYKQNISELDADVGEVNSTYREQKRQTTGTNAQEAAAWREMANAYGLNTGAVGQAALAQNNQLQSNLNALEKAEASALTEIERQKSLLGQQYQLQINEALAENNFNKAQALYQEAVRAEEALTQKQQFASQMMLQYAQLAQNQSQYESDLAYRYAAAGLNPDGTQAYIPVVDPGDGGLGDGNPISDPTPTPRKSMLPSAIAQAKTLLMTGTPENEIASILYNGGIFTVNEVVEAMETIGIYGE